MPVARFQMPDGRVARFEVPEGTTPEQAQTMIAQAMGAQQQQPAPTHSPTEGMGTIERTLAGIGRGMTAVTRAAGAALGATPLGSINRAVNSMLPDAIGGRLSLPTPEQASAASAEAMQIDAPLLGTTAGKVGNVMGMAAAAAPTAFIPGANTYLGAGLVGAGFGGLTTEGDALERLKGAGFGAAGGVAGKAAGDALGTGARWIASKAAARFGSNQAANAQRMAAAQAASREGFVIPPADLQPGMATEALSGLSGKIKTAQAASARNQPLVTDMARRELGMQAGQPLTNDALQAARNAAASSGYAPIRAAGEVSADASYGKALDAIAGQYQGAARSFPGAAKNPVSEMVDGLRQQKFDAGDALDMVKVLRETADKAYRTGDTGLGKASKAAAGALEDQLERHLTAAGNRGALDAFRTARQEIAKTYSVQRALNQQTGEVSAQSLAQQLTKGKPLSGDLLTVARAAQAFPKAFQSLKEAPKQWSPLDFAAGGIGLGAGSPLPAIAAAARPGVRSLLLSGPYQRAALQQATGPGLLSQLPAKTLDTELARLLLTGGGVGLLGGMATNE